MRKQAQEMLYDVSWATVCFVFVVLVTVILTPFFRYYYYYCTISIDSAITHHRGSGFGQNLSAVQGHTESG